MKTHFKPKNNPRVIIIQKLYGKFYNKDNDLDFPDKIHGEAKLFAHIESDSKLSNFLFEYFKNQISG